MATECNELSTQYELMPCYDIDDKIILKEKCLGFVIEQVDGEWCAVSNFLLF